MQLISKATRFFEAINSIGIQDTHSTWEKNTIRKVNVIASTGFLNVLVGLTIFNYWIPNQEKIVAIGMVYSCFFVIYYWLLLKKNFLISSVFIITFGFGLALLLSIFLGMRAGSFLLLLPLLFSSVQIFSTKASLKYLGIVCLMAVLVIVAMIFAHVYVGPLSPVDSYYSDVMFGIFIFYSIFMGIQFNLVIGRSTVENEEKLNKLLKEKEVILSEMFHRVKNNMNVIISILNLKMNMTEHEHTRVVLEEIKGRIYAMAIIHEKIFTNNEEIALNMQEYILDLCNNVAKANKNVNYQFNIDALNVKLDISKAMPCGMILNELITNSFKHFKKDQPLVMNIVFTEKDGECVLEFKDNGCGIDNDIDVGKNTLGMVLIDALSDQLEGETVIENQSGFYFQLQFK